MADSETHARDFCRRAFAGFMARQIPAPAAAMPGGFAGGPALKNAGKEDRAKKSAAIASGLMRGGFFSLALFFCRLLRQALSPGLSRPPR